jgi:hypothetical protein
VAALRSDWVRCRVIAPSSGDITPSLAFEHNTAQGPLPTPFRNLNRNDLELLDQIRSFRSEVGAGMSWRLRDVRLALYRSTSDLDAGGYAAALSYASPILSLGMSGLRPWKNVAWTSNARRSHAKEATLMVETVESSNDGLLMPYVQFDIETLRNPCSRLTPCCTP